MACYTGDRGSKQVTNIRYCQCVLSSYLEEVPDTLHDVYSDVKGVVSLSKVNNHMGVIMRIWAERHGPWEEAQRQCQEGHKLDV